MQGYSLVVSEPEVMVFNSAHTEILIDRPARQVWHAILWSNLESVLAWNPTVTELIHISGERDGEGEVVRAMKNAKRSFFLRTIRVVPNAQRVLFLYGEGYEKGGNFVDHSLYESDGKTRFVYRNYTWKQVPPSEAAQVGAPREGAKSELMDYLNHGLQLLKRYVEAQ